jgi:hypothetical protein
MVKTASAMKVEGVVPTAEGSRYAATALIKAITERCRTNGGYWG